MLYIQSRLSLILSLNLLPLFSRWGNEKTPVYIKANETVKKRNQSV